MKKVFSDAMVRQVDELNNKLIAIEEEIYHLAKEAYYEAEKKLQDNTDGMTDYELDVQLVFYDKEDEVAEWEEMLKHYFVNGRVPRINDKQCHNVSGSLIDNEALNAQKHCWLLHSLYDDQDLTWDDVLSITDMWFGINVSYQYEKELD